MSADFEGNKTQSGEGELGELHLTIQILSPSEDGLESCNAFDRDDTTKRSQTPLPDAHVRGPSSIDKNRSQQDSSRGKFGKDFGSVNPMSIFEAIKRVLFSCFGYENDNKSHELYNSKFQRYELII